MADEKPKIPLCDKYGLFVPLDKAKRSDYLTYKKVEKALSLLENKWVKCVNDADANNEALCSKISKLEKAGEELQKYTWDLKSQVASLENEVAGLKTSKKNLAECLDFLTIEFPHQMEEFFKGQIAYRQDVRVMTGAMGQVMTNQAKVMLGQEKLLNGIDELVSELKKSRK